MPEIDTEKKITADQLSVLIVAYYKRCQMLMNNKLMCGLDENSKGKNLKGKRALFKKIRGVGKKKGPGRIHAFRNRNVPQREKDRRL
ncbi:hypothetical protein TNIN_494711 [Trichonephila inaurata madagascariensis]|uniref:Uncharacterized protein n=1 Tax=Trichonephila inaurata madagascariensis TaxID=2747483 RepID=A0A8X7C4L1_9ARAC|nr:hypothetical protein TNIN_494711 [Trichonephila inaurata madagascariensis]